MATNIFLGYPPENIKNWIIENTQNLTKHSIVKYNDGSSTIYNWSGGLTLSNINEIDNKSNIIEIIIGNDITSINGEIFVDLLYDYDINLTISCINNNISLKDYAFVSYDYGNIQQLKGNLIKLNISDNVIIDGTPFYALYPNIEFTNQSCSTIINWINSGAFGNNSPCGLLTIKCKDGIIKAYCQDEGLDDDGWKYTTETI